MASTECWVEYQLVQHAHSTTVFRGEKNPQTTLQNSAVFFPVYKNTKCQCWIYFSTSPSLSEWYLVCRNYHQVHLLILKQWVLSRVLEQHAHVTDLGEISPKNNIAKFICFSLNTKTLMPIVELFSLHLLSPEWMTFNLFIAMCISLFRDG